MKFRNFEIRYFDRHSYFGIKRSMWQKITVFLNNFFVGTKKFEFLETVRVRSTRKFLLILELTVRRQSCFTS